jgi:hypothetical protein
MHVEVKRRVLPLDFIRHSRRVVDGKHNLRRLLHFHVGEAMWRTFDMQGAATDTAARYMRAKCHKNQAVERRAAVQRWLLQYHSGQHTL